jgi:peroxiredoxin family protein
MCKEISAYLTSKVRFSEIRGVNVNIYFTMWGKRKGDSGKLKLRYNSDANNNKEK